MLMREKYKTSKLLAERMWQNQTQRWKLSQT